LRFGCGSNSIGDLKEFGRQVADFNRPLLWQIAQTSNEALPQTDEACGACGWFVSFLVGLRQGLVKLEIFLEATLA
jgi:hypothetical protein